MCYKSEVEKRGVEFLDDNATDSRIRTAAKWMCKETKPGIMLHGRIGSGKTTLAKAMVQLIRMLFDDYRLGDNRISVVCGSTMDLSKAATSDNDIDYNRYKYAKFLYLDDVGSEPSPTVKSWGNEISPIMELIYYRYDAMKPTIITSNLSLAQMRQFYGDRVGDRMLEMFNGIEFTQTLSYRR